MEEQTLNSKLATIQTKFKSKKSRFNSFAQLGRFLGCLGALLGGLVVQIYCKKQYKTAIFKIVSFRHHGSFAWLLDATLAHFGGVLGPKTAPKVVQKRDLHLSNENGGQNGKCCKVCLYLYLQILFQK